MQLRTWVKKFGAAWHGIWLGLQGERSFWVHLPVATAVVVAGFAFQVTNLEWCVLVFAIALVIALEFMNSAVERLAKAITQEQNEMVGAALDLAAAAVLLSACGAVVVGSIVFVPHVWSFLQK